MLLGYLARLGIILFPRFLQDPVCPLSLGPATASPQKSSDKEPHCYLQKNRLSEASREQQRYLCLIYVVTEEKLALSLQE